MTTDTCLLEEMTWPEVRDATAAGLPVVLPIGSTEQHGPHLPLATDCILPQGVAAEASRQVPLVIAPPVRYGARSRALSGGGEGFPGTLSLRGATLIATVTEVLQALVRTGFRKLVVHNWHYENAGFLWEACDLATGSSPDARMLLIENAMPAFSDEELGELFPDGFGGWEVEHAAIMETSMMMVIRPELVRADRIVDDHVARRPSWDVVPPPQEFIAQSGVLWRPSAASAEIGRKFLDAAARRLAEAIKTEFGA